MSRLSLLGVLFVVGVLLSGGLLDAQVPVGGRRELVAGRQEQLPTAFEEFQTGWGVFFRPIPPSVDVVGSFNIVDAAGFGVIFNMYHRGQYLALQLPDQAFDPIAIVPANVEGMAIGTPLTVSGTVTAGDGLHISNNSFLYSVNGGGGFRQKTHSQGAWGGSETTFFSNAGTTSNATPLTIPLDVAMAFPQNTSCAVDIDVVGRQDTTNRAAYKVRALYHRTTGNVTLTSQTAVSTLESNAAWAAVAVAPASAFGGVQVTGVAATTIYWVVSGTFVCVSTSA